MAGSVKTALLSASGVVQAAARAARWTMSTAARLPRATMELVFPAACVSCHVELDSDEPRATDLPFCDECYESLELLSEPTCRRCGGPLPLLSDVSKREPDSAKKHTGCFRCRGRKVWFDETMGAGLYEGRLRELILKMKRSEGDTLSLAVGRLICQTRREQMTALKPDVVVPIPLHWRRRLVHRTNSAAILAEVLADGLRAPLADGLLRRRRHTPPQSELTPPQRWKNVRQAFSTRAGYHLSDAHVVLVDHVLTTGATCSEAARALRAAGASRVSVIVAARAIGG